jgi:1-acyl-sn-glycerol-3-phosphate acyltransferase
MKHYDRNVKNIARSVHDFFNDLFNHVHVTGPVIDRDLLQNSGLMITCSHRSHYDYFILGMLMHDMGVNNMRFAAGDNLTNLPIIGPKFKAFGSFPIKRSSSFNRSYIINLSNRVVGMIEDNDSIIVFPEGGRSYRGGMMDIKAGVLSAAVIAQARHPQKDVLILPITISYDRLPELSYLGLLQKGKKLRADKTSVVKRLIGHFFYFGADAFAFSKLWLMRKLGVKQGDVFIDFDAPVRVNDLVDIQANFSPSQKDELFAHKKSMQILGTKIHAKLLTLYRLLPVHIASLALKQRPSAANRAEIAGEVDRIMADLSTRKRNLASLSPLSLDNIVDAGIGQLERCKAVRARGGRLHITNQSIVDYYAASIA